MIIPSVYKYIAACLIVMGLLVAVHSHGVNQGTTTEKNVWLERELTTANLQKAKDDKAIADKVVEFNRQEEEKKDILNEYYKQLKDARAYATVVSDRRLQYTSRGASCTNNTGTTKAEVKDTSGTVTAPTTTTLLPEEIERDLRQLLKEADDVTSTALSLQKLAIKRDNNLTQE